MSVIEEYLETDTQKYHTVSVCKCIINNDNNESYWKKMLFARGLQDPFAFSCQARLCHYRLWVSAYKISE